MRRSETRYREERISGETSVGYQSIYDASMSDARSFWDCEIASPQHVSWLEEPVIHRYANTLIGGGTPLWPLDWFERWLHGRRFGRALSVGCGGGALERDLLHRGLVRNIDAFDGSVASLHAAQAAAHAAGLADKVNYFAADFNEPALPRRRYDVVLFHQSAHHVAKLEKLFRAVLLALRPGGLLYLDEYVGPSRFEWNDQLLEPHRRAFRALPEPVRASPELHYPIQADDPSEAFRSSEIEPQLSIGFKTLARRPYGGTLLSVLYPSLRRDALSQELVSRLIEEEKRLLTELPSYYVLMVARPRRGLGKFYANAHYFLVPKLKRAIREIRAHTRRAA